tara:strand:- start:1555 stop:2637 length:1083 start_codon:yes stop_codon:yes gene_type:complete
MKQKTLQEQYNLIQEGKGNAEVFMKAAKKQFPSFVRNSATLNETVSSLKHNHIISESMLGLGMVATNKPTTPDWFKIFNDNVVEEVKAVEKKPTKDVVDLETKGYDYKDKDEVNNMNFEEFLRGYYTELKNPKNADKTEQELKDIVKKNLEKNSLYYVEDAQFGIEGIGYTDQTPGLKASESDKMVPVKLKEGRVTKADWEKMDNDEKEIALLSAYKDPDEAMKYIDSEWKDLKSVATQNMRIDENLPLGEKPKAPKAKKVKKETANSKLAEIEKNGRIATLEMQIGALEEIIESKSQRVSSITEDESMSELMDKKKVKALQKEIKVLEGRKSKMEKMYEKMCGKKYRQQEIVGETKNEE